jgi:hypothetical protein
VQAAPLGSFRDGECDRSGTGSEDILGGGRNLGTCFEEISPDSKRGDQKSVLLGSSLPGRDHRGRKQKRLSSRSSGVVESPRSGGGSDPKLNHVRTIQTNDFGRRTFSLLSYCDSTATGSADQLEHCANTGCPCDPVQSRDKAKKLGCLEVGPNSELGQRSENRIQDHQCEG